MLFEISGGFPEIDFTQADSLLSHPTLNPTHDSFFPVAEG